MLYGSSVEQYTIMHRTFIHHHTLPVPIMHHHTPSHAIIIHDKTTAITHHYTLFFPDILHHPPSFSSASWYNIIICLPPPNTAPWSYNYGHAKTVSTPLPPHTWRHLFPKGQDLLIMTLCSLPLHLLPPLLARSIARHIRHFHLLHVILHNNPPSSSSHDAP